MCIDNILIKTKASPFESPVQWYQIGLEQSVKGSNFVFDGADGLHYKYNKKSLRCGRSYIESHQ